MSAPSSVNVWIRADVTFRHLVNTDTTKVVSFINRPALGSLTIRHPLLQEITGIGLTVGQDGLPVTSAGSVIVRDSHETFGEELRVFDLMAEYTPVEQSVSIYTARTALDNLDPESSWQLVFSGKCTAANKDFTGPQFLSFEVEGFQLPTHEIARVIDETSFPDAIQGAIGRVLPYAFSYGGSLLQTIPIPASYVEDVDGDGLKARYAYQTDKSFEHIEVEPACYGKGPDGTYRSLTSDTVYSFWGVISTGGNIPSTYSTQEQIVRVSAASLCGVMVGGRWRFRGKNNPGLSAPDGTITFNLYISRDGEAAAPDYFPGTTPVATATVLKSDWLTELRGANDFWLTFKWSKPICAGTRHDFRDGSIGDLYVFLGMTQSNFAAGVDFENGGSGTVATFGLREANGWNLVSGAYAPPAEIEKAIPSGYRGYYNDRMIGARCVQYEQTAPVSSQVPCDLSALELIALSRGARDDSSGTITGEASFFLIGENITRPDHVYRFLALEWNGSGWQDPTWYNGSAYSSLYATIFDEPLQREIGGWTQNGSTLTDILGEMTRSSATSLVLRTDGTLALYPWGATLDAKAVLGPDDFKPLSWARLPTESIINKATVAFEPNILGLNIDRAAAGTGLTAYGSSIEWDVSDSASFSHFLGAKSRAIYGEKPLADPAATLSAHRGTATTVLHYLFSTFDHPHVIVTGEVPFWDYHDLELMDVVEVLSPELPAQGGTAIKARLPTYDGEPVNLTQGERWMRAQRYRCQIVGREIAWNSESDPRLILTLRIIKPYHPNDPT